MGDVPGDWLAGRLCSGVGWEAEIPKLCETNRSLWIRLGRQIYSIRYAGLQISECHRPVYEFGPFQAHHVGVADKEDTRPKVLT